MSGSGEIFSADQIGVGPSPVQISTQSFPLISYLDVTQLSGPMRPPSPYTPDMALTQNPNLFHPFPLLPTNQFGYLYLSLYSICFNWAIRTTFRIGPPKDDRTSLEARMARVRIPSGSRPILPAAILSRRFPNHPE